MERRTEQEFSGRQSESEKAKSLQRMSAEMWNSSSVAERSAWIKATDDQLRKRLEARSLPSHVSADDIMQEAWIRFMRTDFGEKPEDYDLTGHVTRNIKWQMKEGMMDRKRGNRVRRLEEYQSANEQDIFDVPSHRQRDIGESVVEALGSADRVQTIIAALGPTKVEELLFLSDKGKTFYEKGDDLGILAGTARQRKRRLLQAARAAVEPSSAAEIIEPEQEHVLITQSGGIFPTFTEHIAQAEATEADYPSEASQPVWKPDFRAIREYVTNLTEIESDNPSETFQSVAPESIETALLFFSHIQRTAATLHFGRGMGLADIAQDLGISNQNVAKKVKEVKGDMIPILGRNFDLEQDMVKVADFVPDEKTDKEFDEKVKRFGTTGEASLILLAKSGMKYGDIEKSCSLPNNSIIDAVDSARRSVFQKMKDAA